MKNQFSTTPILACYYDYVSEKAASLFNMDYIKENWDENNCTILLDILFDIRASVESMIEQTKEIDIAKLSQSTADKKDTNKAPV